MNSQTFSFKFKDVYSPHLSMTPINESGVTVKSIEVYTDIRYKYTGENYSYEIDLDVSGTDEQIAKLVELTGAVRNGGEWVVYK